MSHDGTAVLVRTGSGYRLVDVNSSESSEVATTDLRTLRAPQEEWQAIFDEVWRRFLTSRAPYCKDGRSD